VGSTTHGLPWPAPSDPVAQGAAAIRSLAEQTDLKIGRTLLGRVQASLLRAGELPAPAICDLADFDKTGVKIVGEPLGAQLPADGGIELASITSVVFSSIPSTYQSLELVWSARVEAAGGPLTNLNMQLNGDNTASYDANWFQVTTNVLAANEQYAQTTAFIGWPVMQGSAAGHWGRGRCLIPDYVPFFHERMWLWDAYSKTNNAAGGQLRGGGGGSWRKSAAITQLALYNTVGGAFTAGSQFSLYGLSS